MTALEVREYRGVCKKLVEAEERIKMLSCLLKKGVSLTEDEKFTHRSDRKFRLLGTKNGILEKKHQEMVSLIHLQGVIRKDCV